MSRLRNSRSTTQSPMWGYPVFVLGAVCSFLEPFRGHLSPNIDNISEKLTLRYPHEGPWVVRRRSRRSSKYYFHVMAGMCSMQKIVITTLASLKYNLA